MYEFEGFLRRSDTAWTDPATHVGIGPTEGFGRCRSQLVSTSAPASRGDTLVIYATGLGATLLDPVTGSPAPLTVSPTLLPIQVTLKGSSTGATIAAPVAYAGLAPGFIGVDQLNVQIPANTTTGTVVVQIQSSGVGQALPYTIGIQ